MLYSHIDIATLPQRFFMRTGKHEKELYAILEHSSVLGYTPPPS